MMPLATAIPSAIPLPWEMSPGMIPLLVVFTFLALGVVELTRAAVLQWRRPSVERITHPPMRVSKRAVAA